MSMLHLSPEIRDFVLLPIVLVCIASSIIRSNITIILGRPSPKVSIEDVRKSQLLSRLRNLKANAWLLTEKHFLARKSVFLKKDVGVLHHPPTQSKSAMEQMLQQHQDPSAAMSMLTSQISNIALHGTLGYWISHMFSGFVVAKFPFSLTYQIKSMFQRGVDVPDLDSSYISSLSFYFFVTITSGGLVQVISKLFKFASDGENVSSSAETAMNMVGIPSNISTGPTNPDVAKLYETERENLEVFQHRFRLETVEEDLLEDWKREQGRGA
jgi:ER membrane protein complex subunit 3